MSQLNTSEARGHDARRIIELVSQRPRRIRSLAAELRRCNNHIRTLCDELQAMGLVAINHDQPTGIRSILIRSIVGDWIVTRTDETTKEEGQTSKKDSSSFAINRENEPETKEKKNIQMKKHFFSCAQTGSDRQRQARKPLACLRFCRVLPSQIDAQTGKTGKSPTHLIEERSVRISDGCRISAPCLYRESIGICLSCLSARWFESANCGKRALAVACRLACLRLSAPVACRFEVAHVQ